MASYSITTAAVTRWDQVLAAGTFDASRSSSGVLVFANSDGTFTRLIGSNLTFDSNGPTGGTFNQMDRVVLDGSNAVTTTYETITLFAALAAGVTTANALQYALYGNDSFTGSSGDDVLIGFAANDTLTGSGGTDTAGYLNAIDTGYSISLAANGVINVNAGPANTGEGNDRIEASTEQVSFGGTLYTIKAGTTAADTLTGTAGNDLFVGGGGNDSFTGGGGSDVAAYSGSFSNGYILSISGSTVTVTAGTASNNGAGTSEGTDTLNNIAFVSFNGVVFSTSLIIGASTGAGADSLSGTSGNDILQGGAGNDTISGGAGVDIALLGGASGNYAFIVNADGTLRVTDNRSTSPDGVDSLSSIEFVGFQGGGVFAISSNTTFDANHYSPSGTAFTTDWATLEVGDNGAPVTNTSTLVVFENFVNTNNVLTSDNTYTRVYGTGLTFDANTHLPTGGTVTQIERTSDAAGTVVIERVAHLNVSFSSLVGSTQDIFAVIYSGNDFFTGYTGADTFLGAAGKDTFIGGGGAGINTVSYATATPGVAGSTAGIFADLGNAVNNDSVTLTTPTASLDAVGDRYTGITNLIGSAYDDTMRGTNGAANLLTGGDGNDVLRGVGTGADTLDGGAGTDFADYSNSNAGIVVNLTSTGANTGDAAGDVFISIEAIIGGIFNDTLTGDANSNFVRGGLGADALDGQGGTDYADYRGATTGVLVNLANSTQNTGEAQGDTFTSIEGIRGSNFADYLIGDGGDNFFRSQGGVDTLDGGAGGSDWAEYYATGYTNTTGVTADLGNSANNTGTDAAGDVYINITNLRGTLFADTLRGNASDNKLKGEGGSDSLDGGDGNDTAVYTGSQSDYTVYHNANGTYSVIDNRSGTPDGTDTLTSVELLSFQSSGTQVAIDSVVTNRAPTGAATHSFAAGAEDTPYTVSAASLIEGFSDADFGSLSVANLAETSGTVVDNGNGTYTITPNADFFGTMNLTYNVVDGQGGSVAGSNTIGILPVNDAPVITSNGGGATAAISVAENTTVVTTVTATDVDNTQGELRYSIVATGDFAPFTIDSITGALSFAGAPNFEIPTDINGDHVYNVTVQVSDGAGGTDTQTIAVTVTDVNEAPTAVTFNNAVVSTPENGAAIKVADIAVTDDALGTNTLTLSGADAGSFSIQNGNELWFNGNADFETKSNYIVDVNVNDVSVGGPVDATASFSLAIDDVFEGGGDQTLTGTSAGETLTGGTGNDSITALAGNDLLIGGEGNDTLDAGSGNNTMVGGAGNDLLVQPNSTFSTDAGFADYRAATGPITADFSSANATVTGGISVGTDTLIGANQVAGTADGDTFTATAGYTGANGTFNEFEGMGGNDTISGNGNTRVSYRFADAAVEVDLQDGFGRSLDTPSDSANVGVDSFTGVNAIRGSAFADSLYGSNGTGFEQFRGEAGNDFIDGRGGSADRIDYNTSPGGIVVTMSGGAGTADDGYGTTDTFVNIEQVRGSQFADSISGDSANNSLDGQGGSDTLLGGGGNDTILGAGGNDSIDGGSGTDTLTLTGTIADYSFGVAANGALILTDLRGGSPDGTDTLTGIETLQFTNGNINLSGLPIDAFYRHLEVAGSPATPWFSLDIGGSAEPVLKTDTVIVLTNFDGNGVADGTETRVNGVGLTYDGNGELTGGTVTSVERTSAGGGTVYETITHLNIPAVSFVGAPDLFGIVLAGNDLFVGWSGADVFQGRTGGDTFIGFTGSNAVSYENYVAAVGTTTGVIADFGQNGTGNTFEAAGDRYTNIGVLLGSAYDDVLRGGTGNNIHRGNAGNDNLMGREGADTLDGGAGFDTADYTNLTVGVQIDLVTPANNSGGNGEATGDVYISIENVLTGSGNDTLLGNDGGNILRGSAGADVLDGRGGIDYADYRNVTTSITVDLSNPLNNTVGSHAEGDTYISIEGIRGGSTDDLLIGDGGDNYLRGMLGADTLDGGAGSDWADHNNATTALVVDLSAPGNNTGEAAGDQYISIENLRGGAFSDLLRGDANANAFRGEGGNDTFEGGGGADTAVYAGNQANYTITYNGDGTVTIADTATGAEGTDTLTAVEFAQFADGTIGLTAPPINQAPTAVTLTNIVASVPENGASVKVADIVVTDDGLGTNTFGLSGADASSFSVVNGTNGPELWFNGGANFEVKAAYAVAVTVDDTTVGGTPDLTSATFNLAITNVNEAPTGSATHVFLPGIEDGPYVITAVSLLEGFSDPDGNTLAVANLAAADGSVVDNNDGTYTVMPFPNFYGTTTLTYDVVDGNGGSIAATRPLPFLPVNDAPVITSDGGDTLTFLSVAENSTAVTTVTATDVDNNAASLTYSISGGPDAAAFAVDSISGAVTFVTPLDYENPTDGGDTFGDNIYEAYVQVSDGAGGTDTQLLVVTVTNANDAPTAVTLTNVVTSTPENGGAIKVADIAVTDDTLGTNTLTLSGADANSFSIQNGITGPELWFNGNADFETKSNYVVDVNVNDVSVGGPVDATASFSLAIDDVFEGAGGVTQTGGTGDDTLNGGAGNDSLAGGDGNDVLIGGEGGDTLDGGLGTDTVSYATAGGPVKLDFVNDILTGEAAGDVLNGIEREILSSFDDTYIGDNLTGEVDTVLAGEGNDSITMGAGNDVVSGEAGNDTIDGGAGTDTATFAVGILNYSLTQNGDGSISVDGTNAGLGEGVDTLVNVEQLKFGIPIYAINGPSTTSGLISLTIGGTGADTATGGTGNDITFGGDGADLAIGNAGNDTAVGGAGNDTAQGGSGNDVALGGAGDDRIEGGAGFDLAYYAMGNADSMTGAITVNLAAGTVTGDATVGSDILLSVEAIRGSNYGDTLSAAGFSGSSANAGSNGTNSDFEGMGGDDTITGSGNTRVSYQSASAGVTVDVGAGTADGNSSVGHDVFTGVNQVRGSGFGDLLIGSNASETFEGLGGDDTIQGGGGLDRARYDLVNTGTLGITVNMAAGTVTGRDTTGIGIVGNDLLQSIEQIRGTTLADVYVATGFSGGSANAGSNGTFNEFEGMGGNDTITGNGNTRVNYSQATSGGITVTLGANGSGTSSGGDTGSDTFVSGVNQVRGSNQNDTITGGAANETFEGWGGNDSITGGGGFDQANYAFNAGSLAFSTGMSFNMAAGTASAIGGDTATGANYGSDTLRSIESIRGTGVGDYYDATGFGSSGAANVGNNQSFNEFEGGGGNDTIVGNGNTRISYLNSSGAVTVDLTTGTASGGDVGVDSITFGSFSSIGTVRGSNFGDTLIGTNNPTGTAETFEGMGGDDTINGGGGVDRAFYNGANTGSVGIIVDMAAGTVTGRDAQAIGVVGHDVLQSVEGIRATNAADIYVATGFSGSSANAGSQGTFNEFEGLAVTTRSPATSIPAPTTRRRRQPSLSR